MKIKVSLNFALNSLASPIRFPNFEQFLVIYVQSLQMTDNVEQV